MPKTAGIILIGNEILSGKIEDANAAYLCRELRELGVEVRRITVIPDEVSLIAEEVATFSKAFDLVFTSGGVGPTHDDVTIEGVARAMGVAVVRHPTLVGLLERYYRDTLTDAALRMAEIPDGASYLLRPGAAAFIDAPAGFTAEVAREMTRVAVSITAHADCVRYFDRPRVLYWFMAVSFPLAAVGEAVTPAWSPPAAVGTHV